MVVYVSGKKRKETFQKQEGRFRRGIRFRNVGNWRDYDQRGHFGSEFLGVYLLIKLTATKECSKICTRNNLLRLHVLTLVLDHIVLKF